MWAGQWSWWLVNTPARRTNPSRTFPELIHTHTHIHKSSDYASETRTEPEPEPELGPEAEAWSGTPLPPAAAPTGRRAGGTSALRRGVETRGDAVETGAAGVVERRVGAGGRGAGQVGRRREVFYRSSHPSLARQGRFIGHQGEALGGGGKKRFLSPGHTRPCQKEALA